MSAATETFTIHLPVQAANRLRRIAEISRRPIDDVVMKTLESTLPPLLDDLPPVFQADLASLEAWTNEELRQQIYAVIDAKNLDRSDQLLVKSQADRLNQVERQELDTLRRQADLLMYRKVYAALLLKWRGERIPTAAELEAVG